MNKEEVFKQWTEKLSLSEEELNKELNEVIEDIKKIHEGKTDEEYINHALAAMTTKYRAELKSKAKPYDMYCIGFSQPRDENGWSRSKALKEGRVDKDGKPTHKDHPFLPDGTIIEPLVQRKIFGIAKKTGEEGEFLPFILKMNDLKNLPKLFVKINAKINDKFDEQRQQFWFNGANVTKFNVIDDKEIALPTLAKKYFAKSICKLPNIVSREGKPLGLSISKGIIGSISLTRDTAKSNVIELGEIDISNFDLDSPNVTGFIDKNLKINFGEYSTIYVIGDGYTTDEGTEDERIIMNVCGFWIEPNERIQPAEIPEEKEEVKVGLVTPKDVSPSEEKPKEEKVEEKTTEDPWE